MKGNKVISTYQLIIFGIVPLVMVPIKGEAYFRGKTIVAILVTLFIIGYLAINKNSINIRSHSDRYTVEGFLLVLLILATLSFSQSIDKYIGFFGQDNCPEGLLLYCLYLTTLYLFYRLNSPPFFIIDIMLITACIIAFIGVIEFLRIIRPIHKYLDVYYLWSLNFSTIGNRNFIGTYSVLMLPIAMGMYIFYRRKQGYIYTLFIISMLVISQTRSAYIASVFIGIMILFLSKDDSEQRKRAFKICVEIAAFAMFSILFLYLVFDDIRIIHKIGQLIEDVYHYKSDSSGSDRIFYWRNTLEFLFKYPLLGSGPDNFGLVYRQVHGYNSLNELTYEKAHNEWLNIAVTLGLPYLLMYLTLVGYSIVNLIKKIKTDKYNSEAKIVICVIIGYLIQSQFNISVVPNALIFYGFLGIALSNKAANTK